MNNITNNPVSSSPMGSNTAAPIATPQGAQVQGTSSSKAGASVQPYTFVDGPAGPDTTPTSRLSSSGMPTPASPPQTARESAQVAAFFNAMAASRPADAKAAAEIADLTNMLATLAVKLRKGSLDVRNTMMFVQQEFKKQAIQKEKDAAFKDFQAGIVSGVGGFVGGAIGAGGSIKVLKGTRLGQNISVEERKTNIDLATSKSQAWNSAGNVVSSGFSVASSSVTYEGAKIKAEQKNLELKADLAGSFMAQEGDLANTYRDLFNSSKETFNTNFSTQTQISNSIRG